MQTRLRTQTQLCWLNYASELDYAPVLDYAYSITPIRLRWRKVDYSNSTMQTRLREVNYANLIIWSQLRSREVNYAKSNFSLFELDYVNSTTRSRLRELDYANSTMRNPRIRLRKIDYANLTTWSEKLKVFFSNFKIFKISPMSVELFVTIVTSSRARKNFFLCENKIYRYYFHINNIFL